MGKATMVKYKFLPIFLVVLVSSHLAYGRVIKEDSESINVEKSYISSRGEDMSLKMVEEEASSCDQIYGFLPCSTSIWGLLFLIVVYEVLLSTGERYVASGSELFFEITGPGIFGASLFQFLGTIPQIVLVLVSLLSGSLEAAKDQARLGMGLVAGSTVMMLTIIWGACAVAGSYDLSEAAQDDDQLNRTNLKGFGIITDFETSYTARIMFISIVPFVILQLANFTSSSSWKRTIYLIALVITLILLFSYMFLQIFQPWVQNRRFEYLMHKYVKNKLLQLVSRNGKPDVRRMEKLFRDVDKNNNGSISAAEFRVFLLGIKVDEGPSVNRDVENIMKTFDNSGDAGITKDEFVKGMTQYVSDAKKSEETPDPIRRMFLGITKKNTNEEQQALLAQTPNNTGDDDTPIVSWQQYLEAAFYLIVGIAILLAMAEPLIKTVVSFAQALNLSSFAVSYLVIPIAMNSRSAVSAITSAGQKTTKTISLTLSSLYGGVYMNNVIGLVTFLAPVYFRNFSSDVSAEVIIVLVICAGMGIFTSLRTTFPRWASIIVCLVYPISLVFVYIVTELLGWS